MARKRGPKDIRQIADIEPDARNANRGTPRGQHLLSESIGALGAGRSILVDRNGVAIAGNKTLEAAEAAGLEIEVVRTDGTRLVVVQRVDLELDGEGEGDEGRARLLAYMDNRTSEVGLDWDPQVISDDLDAGLGLSMGFSDWELRALAEQAFPAEKPLEADDAGMEAFRPEANVRMVQLFLTTETVDVFAGWCAALRREYGTDNTTDTVFEAVRRAAEGLAG